MMLKTLSTFTREMLQVHKTEPYVYSQMIAGRFSPCYGQAKNSWLSGSATWSFVALSEGILGIKPQLDGLEIKPCLAKEFKEVKITRKFRGSLFNIDIINKGDKEKSMTVNGVRQDSDLIKLDSNTKVYKVVVKQ
jgi:cellobiose phosphorylase